MMLQAPIPSLLIDLAAKEHLILSIYLGVVHLIVLVKNILTDDMLLQNVIAVLDYYASLSRQSAHCVRLSRSHVS